MGRKRAMRINVNSETIPRALEVTARMTADHRQALGSQRHFKKTF